MVDLRSVNRRYYDLHMLAGRGFCTAEEASPFLCEGASHLQRELQ